MVIESLLEHIGEYFELFLDAWQFRDFERFRSPTSVQPLAVTSLLAGIGIAYILAYAKVLPSLETHLAPDRVGDTPSRRADQRAVPPSEHALLAILLFAGAVLLHIGLQATGWMFDVSWGSPLATLNVSLALQGVYQPVHAVTLRIQRAIASTAYSPFPGRRRVLGSLCTLAELYLAAVFLYGIVIANDVPVGRGLIAVLIGGTLCTVAAIVAVAFLAWPLLPHQRRSH